MRYVVLCHTNIIDRSARGTVHADRVVTKTMLQCVNRNDAERMVRLLENGDDQRLEDGPLIISRAYEVAAELFTSSRNGNRKLTLSTSEMEMIASEYTRPAMAAE